MLRGIKIFAMSPSLWPLGLVPVLIAGLLVSALSIWLFVRIDDLVGWLTPFADSWAGAWRTTVRGGIGLAVIVAWLFAILMTFATVTNVIGQPFYEKISDRIETRLGDPPPGTDAPWWKTLPRATTESAVLLVLVLLLSLPIFVFGFVPVVGQTVIPVIAALVSGFFLAMELIAIPLERRGVRLRARFRFAWREHRAPVIGFGVAAFLLFLVPFMNLLAMPGAVVGATILVRRLTGAKT